MGIAEDWQLEKELAAGAKTKPQATVQLANYSGMAGIGLGEIIPDPNHTRADIPHPTPVLDRLRAAVADPKTDPADRAAARECLRVSFHE